MILFPDSYSITLVPGGLEERIMSITNDGGADLEWTSDVLMPEAGEIYSLAPVTWTPEPDPEVVPGAMPGLRRGIVEAKLNDLSGVQIVWDRSHSQIDTFTHQAIIRDIQDRGAVVHVNHDAITPATLAGRSILWVNDCNSNWTSAELEAVADWVRSGGGLYLEGDNAPSVTAFNAILQAMQADTRFAETDATAGVSTTVYPHDVSEDVTSVYFAGPLTTIMEPLGESVLVAREAGGLPGIAAELCGAGRVVAACDEISMDIAIGGGDNRVLANQIVDWLASVTWVRLTPSAGTVPAGTSSDVTLTFDAEGLCGADAEARIVISGNAPATPTATVHAAMIVTGGPDIVPDTNAIGFGGVPVGTTVNDTLTVRNLGCSTLNVTSMTTDSDAYTVHGNPFSLVPGDERIIVVSFAPADDILYPGLLRFTTNDPHDPTPFVVLSGEGVTGPEIAVEPDSVAVDVTSGITVDMPVTISNVGDMDLEWAAVIEDPVAESGDLWGVSILIDYEHGQSYSSYGSTISQDLHWREAWIDNTWRPITPEDLEDYDIFWTSSLTVAFSESELTALADWVREGGTLYIEGGSDDAIPAHNAMLEAVGSDLRVSQWNCLSGSSTNVRTHTITEGVASVLIGYTDTRLTQEGLESAELLVEDANGTPTVAVQHLGRGRVAVATSSISRDSFIDQDDNRLLCNRLFDWMARDHWIRVEPASGLIPRGGSREVLFRFDSSTTCDPVRAAHVDVRATDDSTPSVRIPVAMNHELTSRISVDRTAIDFGDHFVGAVVRETIVVRNLGCTELEVASFSTDHADFSTDVDSFTLPPDGTWEFAAIHSPTSVGPAAATLSISTNDPAEPVLNISLTGTGVVAPVLAASPDSLRAILNNFESEAARVELRNDGGSDLLLSLTRRHVRSKGRTDDQRAIGDDRSVLLFRDFVPWGADVVPELEALGCTVTRRSSGNLATEDFSLYDMMYITGGLAYSGSPMITQVRDNLDRIEQYLDDGGVLIFVGGTSGGSFDLPSGVRTTFGLSEVDTVTAPDHPIAEGLDEVLSATYSSRDWFEDVPAEADIVTRDDEGMPTTIVYRHGLGTVVALGSAGDCFLPGGTCGDDANMAGLWRNAVSYSLKTSGPLWFTAAPDTATLAPGEALDVDIIFNSLSLIGGDYAGELVIRSNDPVLPLAVVDVGLTVIGTPEIDVSTDTLDLGTVFVHATGRRDLTVANVGTGDLEIAASIGGRSVFSVQPETLVVAPGDEGILTVLLDPVAVGDLADALTLTTNDEDEPTVVVPLSGTALNGPEVSLDTGSVSVDMDSWSTTESELTITNTGDYPLDWTAGVLHDIDIVKDGAGTGFSSLEGVHILWDMAHGQVDTSGWSRILTDLQDRGATVTVNGAYITRVLLENYNLLWLVDFPDDLTMNESYAVADWVSQGGALLLEGHEFFSGFDPLLTTLGAHIDYGYGSCNTGPTSFIVPHSSTVDVSTIYIPNPSTSVEAVGDAVRLVWDSRDRTCVAVETIESGRIAAVSTEIFAEYSIDRGNNRLFANQLVDWLVRPSWVSVSPEIGVIDPGGSETLTLSFDSADYCYGSYDARMILATNAPLSPFMEIPVGISVSAVPLISAAPDTLDLGRTYVGIPLEGSVTVGNTGCGFLSVQSLATDDPSITHEPGPFALGPEQTRNIDVFFSPTESGPVAATMSIISNAAGGDTTTVIVTAEALDPPVPSASPDSLDVTLLNGETLARTLTITNEGGSDMEWSLMIAGPGETPAALASTAPAVDPEADGGPATTATGAGRSPRISDLLGVKVLFDRAHAQPAVTNWSVATGDLMDRGAIVDENFLPLSRAILDDYDVLWIIDCIATFTDDEFDAVSGWVLDGGHLILEGDNAGALPVFNEILAATRAEFRFAAVAGASGVSSDIATHPLTEGVASVYFSSPQASFVDVAAPAAVIANDVQGHPVLVATDAGEGRIVATTDEVFADFTIGEAGNRILAGNVVDWFVGAPWLELQPASGTLAAGASADVQVVFHSNDGQFGDHTANVILETNDPFGDDITVPVTLHIVDVSADPPSRLLPAGWSMIGTPLQHEPGATLEDCILDAAPAGAYLFGYDPETGYTLLDPTDPVVQGQGMWITTPQPFDWTMAGSPDHEGVDVPLNRGWTLVGYPLWRNAPTAGVTVVHGQQAFTYEEAAGWGLVSGTLFGYDDAAAAYAPATTFQPWHAYWVASYADGLALRFTEEGMLYSDPPAAKSDEGWTIRLSLDDSPAALELGRRPDCGPGFDPLHDTPSPPSAPTDTETPTMSFHHPEWSLPTGNRMAADFIGMDDEPASWSIVVVGAAGGTATLRWDASELPPGADLQVYLPATNELATASLRDRDSVTIATSGGPVEVRFQSPDAMPELPWLLEGLNLRNAPNPFNPSTTFHFNLPSRGHAVITVFDLRGAVVRTLDAGTLEAGRRAVVWNGRSDAGGTAASGLYFYRLTVDGRRMGDTRKMSLLK